MKPMCSNNTSSHSPSTRVSAQAELISAFFFFFGGEVRDGRFDSECIPMFFQLSTERDKSDKTNLGSWVQKYNWVISKTFPTTVFQNCYCPCTDPPLPRSVSAYSTCYLPRLECLDICSALQMRTIETNKWKTQTKKEIYIVLIKSRMIK